MYIVDRIEAQMEARACKDKNSIGNNIDLNGNQFHTTRSFTTDIETSCDIVSFSFIRGLIYHSKPRLSAYRVFADRLSASKLFEKAPRLLLSCFEKVAYYFGIICVA